MNLRFQSPLVLNKKAHNYYDKKVHFKDSAKIQIDENNEQAE